MSPGRHECTTCHRAYKYKGGLLQHLRLECGKEPRFCCCYCGYRSKHKSSLKRHVYKIHTDLPWETKVIIPTDVPGKPYACEACGRSYRWLDSLNRHKRLECGKPPQFPCSFCSYRGRQKVHLLQHVYKKHSGSLNSSGDPRTNV
ncbi:hypothetical protein J6590_014722 [Homalodisca vitripennis]|nr:hypothetical protein J6590_014722 [Homalodisca vitripennis]